MSKKQIYLFCDAGMSTSIMVAPEIYGMMDGEKALKEALRLIKQNKK